MADSMLRVGISGLQVFQQSLTTIGQNISNVNTDGYSRQRTEIVARNPIASGNGFIGNGVRISTTERLFSEYSAEQVRQRSASASYFEVLSEFASQVDNLVADPDAGLSPAINDFFDSTQEMSDDPSSIPARNVLLTEANSLVDRFKTMGSWFSNLQKATNNKIANEVSNINELASSIADLNRDIIVATGIGGGQPPNDLLDRRDNLIDKLSRRVAVSTVKSADGSVNVFVGKGQSLVLATRTMKLSALNDPNDPQNKAVGYVDPTTGTATDVSEFLTGGELGGALAFRKEVLRPAINSLGRLALGISTGVNYQQIRGQDLNGDPGAELFDGFALVPDYFGVPNRTLVELYSTNSITNTGTGGISVALDDINFLSTDEYKVAVDTGGNYSITNLSDNSSQPLTVSLAGPPVVFDVFEGMQIQMSGAPTPGVDVFYIRPTRNPSGQINVAIKDPNLIAAAAPLRTSSAFVTNLGDATISEATVTDIYDVELRSTTTITFGNSGGGVALPLADEYTITFTDTGGTLNTLGPNPYPSTPGDPLFDTVNLNGWTLDLAGEAFVGDEFTVSQNMQGVSDNRNALALANLQNIGTMIGGNANYNDAYSELVVLVGNKTRQADVSFEAQNALLTQAKELKDSLSGVNLDEEAANMLKFQQAYAAAAQVISSADQIFQILMNAVRR